MGERLTNLKGLFDNPRTRAIIIFTVIILLVMVAIGLFKFRKQLVDVGGKADVTSAPSAIQSDPGQRNPTNAYADLQQKQNRQNAAQAYSAGTSAVPTLIRSKGVNSDNPDGRGGLGFQSLGEIQRNQGIGIKGGLGDGFGRRELGLMALGLDQYDDGSISPGSCRCTDSTGTVFDLANCSAKRALAEGLDGLLTAGRNGLGGLNGSGRDGMGRNGSAGQGGLNGSGRNGSAGLGGLNGSGRDGMGRNGSAGLGGLNGSGRNGSAGLGGLNGSGRDGMGRNGSAGLGGLNGSGRDGMGRNGSAGLGGLNGSGRDGMGRNGSAGQGGLNGSGRNGSAGLGGLNGSGRDGMGRNGSAGQGGLNGSGRNGSAGLGGLNGSGRDGMGRNGSAGQGGLNGGLGSTNGDIPSLTGSSGAQDLDAIAARQAAEISAKQRQQKVQQLQQAMAGKATSLVSAWGQISSQSYVNGIKTKGGGANGGSAVGGVGGGTQSGAKANAVNGGIMIKAGSIIYAVLQTSINTDEPGPILATIVTGPFKGARLIGTVQTNNEGEKVLLSFSSMTLPNYPSSISISSVAIDPNTSRTAFSTYTDNHILLRYGTLFASAFLSGFGQAVSQSSSVISQNQAGDTVISNVSLGAREKTLIALGTVGSRWGDQLSPIFTRPPTVHVKSGVGLGILFLSDVANPVK